MKRVILTGPTGAIGMALIEYLNSLNIQVIAVVRGDSNRKEQIQESDNIAVVECALSEMAELPQRVRVSVQRKGWNENRSIDSFYHFAWDGTFGDCRNDMYLQNQNVKYALEAVDVAADLGCEVFIGAGSQAEYGRYEGMLNAKVPTFPENGYGMAKLCAGQMTRIRCEQKGIRHIWTRILSVYGPYDGSGSMIMSTIGKVLNGEMPALTKGEQQWDYLYADDAARAFYLLADHGIHGKIYCIGSGIARPLKEYVYMLRDQINPSVPLGIGQIPYGPKQVMYLRADISELTRDTQFKPKYTFEEGIHRTIIWHKEHCYEKN